MSGWSRSPERPGRSRRSPRSVDKAFRALTASRTSGADSATVVFTIGHGARPIGELIALLRSAGVRQLVDVRTAPGSRKHPQFAKAALETSLKAAGIGYVWRQDLGGWRKATPASPHSALRSPAFRIETSAAAPTAIMCAESLWWRCHRRMLADALTARGREVVHVMSGGTLEPHRVHPSARVVGNRVVYDVDRPEQQELPG